MDVLLFKRDKKEENVFKKVTRTGKPEERLIKTDFPFVPLFSKTRRIFFFWNYLRYFFRQISPHFYLHYLWYFLRQISPHLFDYGINGQRLHKCTDICVHGSK